MFKLIGIVVVVSILVIGFESIREWYSGDATPEEAVTEIRERVGKTISGHEQEKGNDTLRNQGAGDGQGGESLQSKLDKL